MSRFRVGQRVKKVRGRNPGMTGVVIGPSEFQWQGKHFDIEVRIDCGRYDDQGNYRFPGEASHCKSDQWEPILDDDTRALGAELLRRWTGEGVVA